METVVLVARAIPESKLYIRLPDNCAPYVIIYTGAQLSGSGAQLSGLGVQLSGPGAQLSAILVCIPTYVISPPLCMYRSLEAPSKTSDTIFWVAVMRWSAAFLFRELKKVDFSSMRLSGAWLCGLEPWSLAESVVGIKIDHGVTLEGPVLRASPGSVEGGVLILLSAVGKVVRIEEELRISLPRQKLGKHNNHF